MNFPVAFPARFLMLLALVAAGCRIDPEAFSDSYEDSSGRMQYQWNGPDNQLKVTAKGELVFSEDDSDVVSISSGGEFSVEESRDGSVRRIEISPLEDGSLRRVFWLNGRSQEFDREARDWLRGVLPRVLRETAFDAAARVGRLRGQGGAQAVLDEISKIDSGSARRVYLEELLVSGLDKNELIRAIGEAERIGSSSDLSRILVQLAAQAPGDAAATAALIRASRQIQSSSSRRQALMAVAQERELNEDNAVALAAAAAEMRSDSEKAMTLRLIAEKSPPNGAALEALLEAAATIRSSSEKGLVVRDLLSAGQPIDRYFIKVVDVASGIRSSSEKALLLVKLAGVLNDEDQPSRAAFLSAVAGIDSIADRERVLSALVAREPNSETLKEILAFAESEMPEGPLRRRLIDRTRRKLQ